MERTATSKQAPLCTTQGIGCAVVGVPTDAAGLDPEALASLLASWGGDRPKPRVLYTVPTGSNPTGATMPLARRRRLLEVAREHDLAVIEGGGGGEYASGCGGSPREVAVGGLPASRPLASDRLLPPLFFCAPSADDPYYFLSYSAERVPSLLSLDTDGRVVRCDSLSKVGRLVPQIKTYGTVLQRKGPKEIVRWRSCH